MLSLDLGDDINDGKDGVHGPCGVKSREDGVPGPGGGVGLEQLSLLHHEDVQLVHNTSV